MNTRSIKAKFSVLSASLVLSLAWAPAVASAANVNNTPATTNNTPATSDKGSTTSQTKELANIISRGDKEIERRLANLDKLNSLISSSLKLTTPEQTALESQITSAEAGLTSLKATLDSETTVTAARADVQNIVLEYRVYALVDPKIHLLKTADDQQAIEAKLVTLAQKLQTRITTASSGGQDVSTLQSDLTDMTNQTTLAQTISSGVETSVESLQPTDYNSDHSILGGYNVKLQTARHDIKTAYEDAKAIVTGLETQKNTSSNSSTNSSTH